MVVLLLSWLIPNPDYNHVCGAATTPGLAVLLQLMRVLSYNDTRYESIYLVDPASSHMLVSKIKPCMSKYKPI